MTVVATGLLPTFAALSVPQSISMGASDEFARALSGLEGQATGAADASAMPLPALSAPVPPLLQGVQAAPDPAGRAFVRLASDVAVPPAETAGVRPLPLPGPSRFDPSAAAGAPLVETRDPAEVFSPQAKATPAGPLPVAPAATASKTGAALQPLAPCQARPGMPAAAALPQTEAREPDGLVAPQGNAAFKRARISKADAAPASAPPPPGTAAAPAAGAPADAAPRMAVAVAGAVGKPADRSAIADAKKDDDRPTAAPATMPPSAGASQPPLAAALPSPAATAPAASPLARTANALGGAGVASAEPAREHVTDSRQLTSAPSAGAGEATAISAVVAAPATVQPGAASATPIPAAVSAPPIAHANATVVARPGQIGHETGIEIARAIDIKSSALTIRLDPADMGRIEVRLSFNDQGSLRAVVSADNPASLDLLRRDSVQLGQALNDAGVQADAQSFRFDSRSGGGDGGQAWARRPEAAASAQSAPADTTATEAAAAVRYGSLRSSGNLDLFA